MILWDSVLVPITNNISKQRIEDSDEQNSSDCTKNIKHVLGKNKKLVTHRLSRGMMFLLLFLYLLMSFRSYSPTPQSCSLHLLRWKSLHRQVGIVTSCTNDLPVSAVKNLIFHTYWVSLCFEPHQSGTCSVFVWIDTSRPVRCNRDKSQEFLT